MIPSVMPGSGGASVGSVPTSGAIAASRAAASAGSGTQITLPSSMENSMAWRALGSALLVVGVEQRVRAPCR